jgi:hypothetical protein
MGIYSAGFLALVDCGSQWRRGRRLFHEFLNAKAVLTFDDHQHKSAHRFLSLLAQTPDNFFEHAQLYVPIRTRFSCIHTGLTLILPSVIGALVMEITYGLDIESHEDKFLQAAEHAAEYIERIVAPGAFLVDTFPIRSFSL